MKKQRMAKCPLCYGKGRVVNEQLSSTAIVYSTCPWCGGIGELPINKTELVFMGEHYEFKEQSQEGGE